MQALAAQLDALSAPERTLIDCTLAGVLFGSEYEALSSLREIIEGRFSSAVTT